MLIAKQRWMTASAPNPATRVRLAVVMSASNAEHRAPACAVSYWFFKWLIWSAGT